VRVGAIGPLAVIALFALLDVASGPDRPLLGMVVIGPLLAASTGGRAVTAAVAALALLTAAALGVSNGIYTADGWPMLAAQMFGVVLGGLVAVGACDIRLQREARLAQLTSEVAETRARMRGAEHVATLAEAVQRSVLTDPPRLPHLEIGVRYLPAAEHVRIGGDWYDAFGLAGGRTALVVGDVAGHDGGAATTMTQIRTLLRGVAHVLGERPAAVLRALDAATCELNPGALATLVLLDVPPAGDDGALRVRWSNAGHPPPLLVRAGGAVSLLEVDPDPLIGVAPLTRRRDHDLVLAVGDTVVMFTDGLVERRGEPIDEGLRWVCEAAAGACAGSLETLCDALVGGLLGRADDDIAVLAVRVRAQPPVGPLG
jgi:serine phosphatase RsbU (regulator of sigma subunit)